MIPKEYEKYEKTVTISVVNFNPVWGNKPATLEKIKTTVSLAAQLGSNIIAFPELALSGYECGEEARYEQKPCSMHLEAAETIPGPSTENVAKLARELGVYVIFGMPERNEKEPKVIYNSAAVIGPKGVLGKYRKLRLAPLPIFTERACFQPGNELPVFETEYGPIGVQICADLAVYPEFSRILWLKGARLIFCCWAVFVGPGRDPILPVATRCRGAESYIYIASSNIVGTERTLTYCGNSTIAGPSFPSRFQIFAQGGMYEEIVTATLNFESLHYQWSRSGLKKEHYTELIAKEFTKLVGR